MTVALATKGYVCQVAKKPLVIVDPGLACIHNIIRDRIEEVLKPLVPDCLIQYDNAPFDKPSQSCWIRATTIISDSKQADTGAKKRRFRTIGILVFDIYSPLVTGDNDGNEIADICSQVFRAADVGGVKFKTPSMRNRKRESAEWVVKVNCPFFADQLG